ncbi:hypothetical protein [Streptomyces sp. NPDC053431]
MDHLDGTITGFRYGRGDAGLHRSGGGLGVDGVGLPEASAGSGGLGG